MEAGPPGPRSSREYTVTDVGVTALAEWLNKGPAGEVIRMPILLTIRFGARLEPERLRHILAEFSSRHEANRALYAELETDMRNARNDPFEIATVRFGRLFESAVEAWLDELPELLTDVVAPPSLLASTLDDA